MLPTVGTNGSRSKEYSTWKPGYIVPANPYRPTPPLSSPFSETWHPTPRALAGKCSRVLLRCSKSVESLPPSAKMIVMAASRAAAQNRTGHLNMGKHPRRTPSLNADLIGKEESERWDTWEVKSRVLNRQAGSRGLLAPREPQVLKQGKVFKLTSHQDSWVEKTMIVSSTQVILSEVTCSEETGDAFQDYIPLHEISKVERSMFSNEDESSITRVPSLDANLNSHRRPSALQGLLPVRLRGSMRSQGPPEEGQGGMFEIHTSEDGRNSGVHHFPNSLLDHSECTCCPIDLEPFDQVACINSRQILLTKARCGLSCSLYNPSCGRKKSENRV